MRNVLAILVKIIATALKKCALLVSACSITRGLAGNLELVNYTGEAEPVGGNRISDEANVSTFNLIRRAPM